MSTSGIPRDQILKESSNLSTLGIPKKQWKNTAKWFLVKMIKDLAGSIDNLVQVVSLDGGNEVKNGNQNVSVSIEKIEEDKKPNLRIRECQRG